MSSIGPVKQARKALLWLLVVVIIATGVLVAGVSTGKTGAAPKLALDLEGGTQMILAPRVKGNETISQEQLDQAVEIIRQRVDGSGVSKPKSPPSLDVTSSCRCPVPRTLKLAS